ncbi:MAG: HupE/UreJ family protein [Bacteroidales bacterium]|nr:HupE/UreJ family protein [Bacteroidales bacterium]
MNIFQFYLNLGFNHIADLHAYDHILFIVTLCAAYSFSQWKKVLILVTAFTIGHSLTLALATFNILKVNLAWIEFLIPFTIFLTAFANLLQKSGKVSKGRHLFKYFIATFFGLIHGLGFSSYLKSLLGKADNIIIPLFAFNIGIELGQIIIVAIIMAITWILVDLFHVNKREWVLILSGAGLGVSLVMMLERFPGL